MRSYSPIIRISLILFFLTFLPGAARAVDFQTVLHEDEYHETLQKLFFEAETSINIVIDTIIINPFDPKNPINKLIETLLEAKQKGVSVRIILEDSHAPKNFITYRSLLERGIDVYFDTSKLLINSKAIVIDSHICVVGGSNWTPEAWRKNHAVAVILNSENMAVTIEDSISKLILEERPSFAGEEPKGILIPNDFLLLKKFGMEFITERANKPFDLYLALIKEAQEISSNEFLFDYEKYGKILSLKEEFFREFKNEEEKKEHYYNKIKEFLKVLENRYNLVEYDEAGSRITLLEQFGIDLSKPGKNSPCFVLPDKFWSAKFPHRLNLNAKYLYLVSLLEVKKSLKAPYWFSNEYILSSLYGLNPSSISAALEKLKEINLIEIARAPHVEGESKKKEKNVYYMNRIMTGEEFSGKIEEFKLKYGEDITIQAQKQAAELNDPNDLFIIKTFIGLIQKYGYSAVRGASTDTLRHEKGSNLRHISTTIDLLEKD